MITHTDEEVRESLRNHLRNAAAAFQKMLEDTRPTPRPFHSPAMTEMRLMHVPHHLGMCLEWNGVRVTVPNEERQIERIVSEIGHREQAMFLNVYRPGVVKFRADGSIDLEHLAEDEDGDGDDDAEGEEN